MPKNTQSATFHRESKPHRRTDCISGRWLVHTLTRYLAFFASACAIS